MVIRNAIYVDPESTQITIQSDPIPTILPDIRDIRVMIDRPHFTLNPTSCVVGRIDSIKGQIRANFEATPDVPLTKVTIQMQGGKKGLLINSRDICAQPYRTNLELEAHNGSAYEATPVLKNGKCGAVRKSKRGHGD